MITHDGWFSWMERDPGPPAKVNGGINGGKGIIPHSAEGYRTVLREILFGPRRASWHISVLTNKAIQHYPITAQTWTSGSGYPNNNFLAGETEGVEGEPWNQFQIDTWVRVGRELRAVQGWIARRPLDGNDRSASCYEHNECVRFGSEYTSCPSGRNPWRVLIPAINASGEAEDMKSFLCWDITNKRVMFVGPSGPVWIVSAVTVTELEKQFGPMTVALTADALKALGAK